MTDKRLFTAITASLFVFCADIYAAPITLTGNYISVAINDVTGTLGSGNQTGLGLKFDPSGTGHFNNANDFISPGSAYENFVIHSDQTASNSAISGTLNNTSGLVVNNNSPFYPKLVPETSLLDSSSGNIHSALWTGTYTDFGGDLSQLTNYFTVSNLYSFDDNAKSINVTTTITALTNLTGLTFLRSVDPNQDAGNPQNPTDDTVNVRGLSTQTLSANDIVSATGQSTGLTLALFSDSPVAHNTGITFPGSYNPNDYLNGLDQSHGLNSDSVIGLAFNIGSLAEGQKITLTYDYILSTTTAVPLPGAAWLFLSGLGIGLRALRKHNH